MAPDKIALADLSNAEAEADALLREDDEREGRKSLGDGDVRLEDLEATEGLPTPATAASAVSTE